MMGKSIYDVVSDCFCNIIEEGSAWSDKVGVKAFLIDIVLYLFYLGLVDLILFKFIQQLLFLYFDLVSFHGCSEPSWSLLVHFGSWGNTINGKV